MTSAALVLAVVLSVDGGTPDVMRIYAAKGCADTPTLDGGCEAGDLVEGPAWRISPQHMVKLGTKLQACEACEAAAKNPPEQVVPFGSAMAQTPSWMFWAGFGAGVTSTVGLVAILLQVVKQ